MRNPSVKHPGTGACIAKMRHRLEPWTCTSDDSHRACTAYKDYSQSNPSHERVVATELLSIGSVSADDASVVTAMQGSWGGHSPQGAALQPISGSPVTLMAVNFL